KLTAILMVGILLLTGCISCNSSSNGGNGGTDGPNKADEFEVIRQAADAYLSTGKVNDILEGTEVWDILTDADKSNDPNILSVRLYKTYKLGHLCTAINVPFRAMFKPTLYAAIPPQDKKLLVYGYTGNESGGMATAYLNMLGWDAIQMRWGFTCWMLCPNTAPGLFRSSILGGVGNNYATEATVNMATQTYSFPRVENTHSDDPADIIKAAGSKYVLTEVDPPTGYIGTAIFYKDLSITTKDVFNLLIDSDSNNDPFILSVQSEELYAKGHVPGAVHMPVTDVCQTENLAKLPTDRQIVVTSTDGMTGSQVTGILNLLGYDAYNMYYGMMAWTRSTEIVPDPFVEYKPGTESHQDILDLAFCFGNLPGYWDGFTPVSNY
ncbi:rhodanese-like domain-containing protein, partial [Chloroflexota bacterium]